MKILFVTDPHLGLSRKANFTAESSARREDWSRRLLGDILDAPVDHRICPGDFFDRHSNSETTILDVRHLAQRFDLILAGNHDLSNRTGTRSSLDVIGAITKNVAKEPMTLIFSNAAVHVVPHCMTQALFEHALEQLQPEPGWYNLLILHCNYGVEFALDESALNLSEAMAIKLLSQFHHILVGHVHTPKTYFDGRLHLIGSHVPTAFDNLEDKRHLIFDTDTGAMTSHVHWVCDEHVYRGPPSAAPDGRQFYDFTEPCDAKLPVRLFKEGAFGVRLFQDQSQASAPVFGPIEPLTTVIARELGKSDPDLLALWTTLSHVN